MIKLRYYQPIEVLKFAEYTVFAPLRQNMIVIFPYISVIQFYQDLCR